ncbi:MAG: head fiber protein [Sphaerochaetaceae bacterium]|jgi:hypothetical protein|nr:head fiber protein [Sphaerochaetaceae bacterium]
MSYNSKNHAEQGGEKTVIGGELEILSGGKIKVNAGATVEGLQRSAYVLPAATAEALGGVKKAAAQADSIAEDAAGLVTDFNALLAKLRTAGILSAE